MEVEKDLQDAYYLSTKGGALCTSIAKRPQIFPLANHICGIKYLHKAPPTQSSFLLARLCIPPEGTLLYVLWAEGIFFPAVTYKAGDIDLGLGILPRQNG